MDWTPALLAGEEKNQEVRQRVLKALFAIYTSPAGSYEIGEDIPDLLTGNTTAEERQMIAGWVRDRLSKEGSAYDAYGGYSALLRRLEKR